MTITKSSTTHALLNYLTAKTYFFFVKRGTPGSANGLLLTLNFRVTPGKVQGTIEVLAIKPKLVTCKANAIVILLLQISANTYFNFIFSFHIFLILLKQ